MITSNLNVTSGLKKKKKKKHGNKLKASAEHTPVGGGHNICPFFVYSPLPFISLFTAFMW